MTAADEQVAHEQRVRVISGQPGSSPSQGRGGAGNGTCGSGKIINNQMVSSRVDKINLTPSVENEKRYKPSMCLPQC